MKLAYFDDFKLGVVDGAEIIDVTDALQDIPHRDNKDLMAGLIAQFDIYRPRLEKAVSNGVGISLASVKLCPPLPRPMTIDCMAVNYMEDGTRDEPEPINAFPKSPSCIIGPEDTMVLEDIPAAVFEGEAEIAVIIGKRARNVSAADAMDYVFGYTNFIDGSARRLQPPGTNSFFQMKSRETYAPIGPYVVTADEITDPQNVQITLSVNGVIKQNFNTNDMAHNIRRSIEWITSLHTLEPGDILATGTNHRGLNAFQDGDVVELECAGLDVLRIHVKDDLKRTWSRETRLERQQGGASSPLAPQLSGKYMPVE